MTDRSVRCCGLRIDDLPDGGVRLVARDWPCAGWVAVVVGLPALALLAWAAVEGRAIEFGGAAIGCALAATAGWLALAKRRRVELREGELVAREGAGPFARAVRREFSETPSFEVRPFPTPDGAPELDDRGADLILVAGALRYPLARRAGPDWKALEDARVRLTAALG